MSDPAILSALRELYSAPEWLVLGEVRSGTGFREEVRYADALAVNMWPSSTDRLIGFEFKAATLARHARADLRRELKRPEKARAIGRFCSLWYLVVRAPWKKTLFSFDELPEGWGLIEVGTGKPVVVRQGVERMAESLSEALMLSLIRSASEQGNDERGGARHGKVMAAPLRQVSRPRLSREHMGLACGHVLPRPLIKAPPPRVNCEACAAGLPIDRQMLEAIVCDMGPAELADAAALIERRRSLQVLRGELSNG